jgi:RNA recognition motif-containing protein
MAKRIYVGNLPWSVTSTELEEMFAAFGPVRSAEVISDRVTGQSRGFGFVEMDGDDSFDQAINALNGKDCGGRQLVVNEAQERTPRAGGGGGRYEGGGRGFGGSRRD